ncbi:MAG: hypothetical protein J6A01_10300 [Proteobacteria bacterium]|nr:hypothetical protein [Pseudomonadota bacterium]
MFKLAKHILWVATAYSLCGCALDTWDIEKITDDPEHRVYCPDDSNKAELDFIQITKNADEEQEGKLCSRDECLSKKDCCGLNKKYAEKYFLAFSHRICPQNLICLRDDEKKYYCGPEQLECSANKAKCGNECADLNTDVKHCGKCNSPCDLNTIPNAEQVSCIEGICTLVRCKKGYLLDSNQNTCTQESELSCAGRYCSDSAGWIKGECLDDKCVADECDVDYHILNGVNEDDRYLACEKDSNLRCGEPPVPCSIPENAKTSKCKDGKCQIENCEPGFHPNQENTNCEADTIRACGAINADCYALAAWGDGDDDYQDNDGYCDKGNCHANACAQGYHPYNQFVDSKFVPCQKDDINNCGAPNLKCVEPKPLCQNGKCIENCTGDMALCNSGCVNIKTDVDNCNGCGNKCPDRPNMNVTCNGSCIYSCKKGYENCDNDSNNGCELLLSDRHWSACRTCESGYKDCDNNEANGCEIKLAEYGLKDCRACTDEYINCGLYAKNTNIASCLKEGNNWNKDTPFTKFCEERCNSTKSILTYPTSETIHHPSVCKPKQYCARKDDPYPDYYYRCTDSK